jgi:hypothetical protein
MEFLHLNVPIQDRLDATFGERAPPAVADNRSSGMKWRRQGRKKPAGVREKGVEDLDAAFREGPHADYLRKYGHNVLRMRDSLQNPPPGILTWKDLRWNIEAEKETRLEEDPQSHKRKQSKLIAYIPWDRVGDFVHGEQSGRKDVETSFVRDKNDPTNVGEKTRYRWNCHIDYQR